MCEKNSFLYYHDTRYTFNWKKNRCSLEKKIPVSQSLENVLKHKINQI